MSASKQDAIALAEQSVREGHALRYSVTADCVEVESEQGWQTWWPQDITYNPETNL